MRKLVNYDESVSEIVRVMSRAVNRRITAVCNGEVTQEPDFTSQMVGAIQEAVWDYRAAGISWTARVLSDRGRGAEESLIGADLLAVLNVNLRGYHVSKGFLAQGKLNYDASAAERSRMERQCDKMLKVTDEAFVFHYSSTGVNVVRASEYVPADTSTTLYHAPIEVFLEHHLRCIIGDRSLRTATPGQMQQLIERVRPRTTLELFAESPGRHRS